MPLDTAEKRRLHGIAVMKKRQAEKAGMAERAGKNIKSRRERLAEAEDAAVRGRRKAAQSTDSNNP